MLQNTCRVFQCFHCCSNVNHEFCKSSTTSRFVIVVDCSLVTMLRICIFDIPKLNDRMIETGTQQYKRYSCAAMKCSIICHSSHLSEFGLAQGRGALSIVGGRHAHVVSAAGQAVVVHVHVERCGGRTEHDAQQLFQ
jgi:hypothetical protein